MEDDVFVTPLERVDGEYIVRIPHDLIVQQDLREGQVLSIVIEPLSNYSQIESRPEELVDGRWRLNEEAPEYRHVHRPES